MVLLMTKKIKIEILPDGSISAKTDGIKGKECLDYIKILEAMLEAKTVDSDFLKEYYEIEELNTFTSEKITPM